MESNTFDAMHVKCPACGQERTTEYPFNTDCPECYQFMKRLYKSTHDIIENLRQQLRDKEMVLDSFRRDVECVPTESSVTEHVGYLEDTIREMQRVNEKEQASRDQMLSQIAVQMGSMGAEIGTYRKCLNGLKPILRQIDEAQTQSMTRLIGIINDVLAADFSD